MIKICDTNEYGYWKVFEGDNVEVEVLKRFDSYYLEDRDNCRYYAIAAWDSETDEITCWVLYAESWFYNNVPEQERYKVSLQELKKTWPENLYHHITRYKPNKDYIII